MKTWFALLAVTLGLSAAAPPPLTPDGWGALRVGMSEREAVRRFGFKIPSDDDGVSSFACRELAAKAVPVSVMTERGIVTRLSLFDRALRTDRGLTVGASEEDVRRAYGQLEVEPHKYDDPPAKYLTYWDKARGRGVRFETDQHRRVVRLHVGGPSIRYVEGCL